MKVALFLRAVNLTGRPLPMADLKAMLAGVGLAGAATVGASGNAVVEAKAADGGLEGRVEAALQAALGRTTEVYARSGRDLAAVIAANPFPDFARTDPGHMAVVFLRRDPAAAAVAALQPKITGRETVAPGPRCLFACYPDGMGRSKLTAAMIEKALGDRGTARNWNTLGKLAVLTAAA